MKEYPCRTIIQPWTLRRRPTWTHAASTSSIKLRKGNGGRQPSAGPAVTIDVPDKNLKFSRADIEERERWKDNQRAYEACLMAPSTKIAPCYAVPADAKENARLITYGDKDDWRQRRPAGVMHPPGPGQFCRA
jgi:hypothetical protein